LPPRFELRIAVLAALALLLAQLGALSHAYAHDAATGSSLAGAHGARPPATSRPLGAAGHDACNECLAYAPLLCAAGAPAALPAVDPQGRTLATRPTADSLVDLRATLAFRARAPPAAP
jgi:hypothetical protein